jgi:hypothetical protein
METGEGGVEEETESGEEDRESGEDSARPEDELEDPTDERAADRADGLDIMALSDEYVGSTEPFIGWNEPNRFILDPPEMIPSDDQLATRMDRPALTADGEGVMARPAIEYADPFAVEWSTNMDHRKDYMTFMSRLSQWMTDDPDEESQAPIATMIEQLVKSKSPLAFQVTFRPNSDWSADRSKRQSTLEANKGPLPVRIARTFHPSAGAGGTGGGHQRHRHRHRTKRPHQPDGERGGGSGASHSRTPPGYDRTGRKRGGKGNHGGGGGAPTSNRGPAEGTKKRKKLEEIKQNDASVSFTANFRAVGHMLDADAPGTTAERVPTREEVRQTVENVKSSLAMFGTSNYGLRGTSYMPSNGLRQRIIVEKLEGGVCGARPLRQARGRREPGVASHTAPLRALAGGAGGVHHGAVGEPALAGGDAGDEGRPGVPRARRGAGTGTPPAPPGGDGNGPAVRAGGAGAGVGEGQRGRPGGLGPGRRRGR